tara:strand:+ start:9549 stop:10439 length:891 start_codon:yes stop_codon:yes gene_type:complete
MAIFTFLLFFTTFFLILEHPENVNIRHRTIKRFIFIKCIKMRFFLLKSINLYNLRNKMYKIKNFTKFKNIELKDSIFSAVFEKEKILLAEIKGSKLYTMKSIYSEEVDNVIEDLNSKGLLEERIIKFNKHFNNFFESHNKEMINREVDRLIRFQNLYKNKSYKEIKEDYSFQSYLNGDKNSRWLNIQESLESLKVEDMPMEKKIVVYEIESFFNHLISKSIKLKKEEVKVKESLNLMRQKSIYNSKVDNLVKNWNIYFNNIDYKSEDINLFDSNVIKKMSSISAKNYNQLNMILNN